MSNVARRWSQVRQLSNKSVSWIRRRDAHILTVDRFTFIADERFQAFLVEATDTWTLQVSHRPTVALPPPYRRPTIALYCIPTQVAVPYR